MKRLCLLLFLVSILKASCANILPSDRLPANGTWANLVGISGGIPNRTTIYTNFTSSATVAQINSAIANCPSNQVVYLNAGTYNLSSDIALTKNGVTLRGAGPTQTIISGGRIGGVQSYPPFDNPGGQQHINITGGLTQGSTALTLASNPTTISVGTIAHIDQLNDTNTSAVVNPGQGIGSGLYVSVAFPNDGRDRYKNQAVRIVAISGNIVTIDPEIHSTDWDSSKTPQLWGGTSQPYTMMGVEDLGISRTASDVDCVTMDNFYQCWVKNCNFNGGKNMVFFRFGARAEVRHCYFTGPCFDDPYAISFYNMSGGWAEDNIFNGFQNPGSRGCAMLGNACTGGAWTYNYHTNTAPNLSAWQYLYTIQTHGGHCEWNLSEGNVGAGWTIEGTWGSAGYNVDIRSRWFGWDEGNTQTQSTLNNVEAVTISATNRHCSIVGSVLGTSGKNTIYEDTSPCTANGGFSRVFFIGNIQAYCSDLAGAYDSIANTTLIRAMNWDSANNGIVTGGYTVGDIPSSLIYASKPAFFGILTWPPISPDNVTLANSRTNIPAAYRFAFGVDPPSGDLPISVSIDGKVGFGGKVN